MQSIEKKVFLFSMLLRSLELVLFGFVDLPTDYRFFTEWYCLGSRMRSDAFSLLGENQEYLDQGLVGLEEWYGKENGTA